VVPVVEKPGLAVGLERRGANTVVARVAGAEYCRVLISRQRHHDVASEKRSGQERRASRQGRTGKRTVQALLVLHHVGALVEALAAHVAHVGARVGVHDHVPLVVDVAELAVADGAEERGRLGAGHHQRQPGRHGGRQRVQVACSPFRKSRTATHAKNHSTTYMRIGGRREGGLSPSLGCRKRLLVSDFWKINKKFHENTWENIVLGISVKKVSVQMRMRMKKGAFTPN